MFACDVTHLSGSATLDIDVEHRNQDDAGWASAGTFTQFTATGIGSKDLSNLKELIRFKFVVGGSNATSAVAIVMPTPQWFPI